ncbi:MAG: TonB-dependent receptor [Gammaproteobacteria bacterium]|nr:TonB-dependent receptor [Gammaproteobacteria bacterium]MBU1731538.1 TonB-dependent receptor [Gammaproteobacteria bacterium]MBU1893042.1 TonB-dependent receptor [Gammaproteobacteria bacterium]
MKILAPVIPFLGLFLTLTAHADSGAGMDQLLSLNLEELTKTKIKISTNTEQALSKAPSVVSVITAEDIRATGASNLTEILQSVPGIYIKPNLFGFKPQVTFRGAAPTHTLLMVNGIPMRDLLWSSGIYGKGLTTSMIERVEIIRGPGSALFGSDASAGVVNVITKTAGKIEQVEAGARAGSFDTQAGWVQGGGNWNGFDLGFTAELSHTGGHNPFIAVDGQTASDLIYGTRVSSAPGNARYGWDGADLRFSMARGNWRLLADHLAHSNVEVGLTGAAVLDPLTRGSDSRSNIQLLYSDNEFARNWGLNAEARYFHLDYTSGDGYYERPPGYADASGTYPDGFINRMRSAERGFVVEGSALYSGLKQHAIRLGGGYSSENLYLAEQYINLGTGPDGSPLPAGGPLVNLSDSPYVFAPEKTREISYLFLQDVWTLARDLELTAGARYDHYSDFGRSINPRLALVWQSTDRLTTKLMYGEAFRAPTYLQLYALTAATTPNPDLKPERSQTWDLLFSYQASKDMILSLDLYQFEQRDLIATDSLNQFQNTCHNLAQGVELEAKWQATKALRVSGNLNYREDSTFNTIPGQNAYLRTDWAFMPRWNWNVQANWIGRHPSYGSRAPIGSYTLIDSTIRYSRKRDWEFAASIRNLFDVDAREYSSSSLLNNLPLPGRSFYAEVRYKF